jgi:hypothetical protein
MCFNHYFAEYQWVCSTVVLQDVNVGVNPEYFKKGMGKGLFMKSICIASYALNQSPINICIILTNNVSN